MRHSLGLCLAIRQFCTILFFKLYTENILSVHLKCVNQMDRPSLTKSSHGNCGEDAPGTPHPQKCILMGVSVAPTAKGEKQRVESEPRVQIPLSQLHKRTHLRIFFSVEQGKHSNVACSEQGNHVKQTCNPLHGKGLSPCGIIHHLEEHLCQRRDWNKSQGGLQI